MLLPADLIGVEIGDCGCPEESYLFNGIDLVMHFEPDGQVDAFLDGGDWGQTEATVHATSRFAGRLAIFKWALERTEGPER